MRLPAMVYKLIFVFIYSWSIVVITNPLVWAQVGLTQESIQSAENDPIDLHLKDSEEDSPKYLDVGLFGTYSAPTADTRQGYGAGLTLDYTKHEPFVIRSGLYLSFWEIDVVPLVGARFTSFVWNVALLYRYSGDIVKPYGGVGLSLYWNSSNSDRVTGYLIDSLGQVHFDKSFDGGRGVAPTLKTGCQFQLASRIKLDVELSYMISRPSADISWQVPYLIEGRPAELQYDRNVATLMLGLVVVTK